MSAERGASGEHRVMDAAAIEAALDRMAGEIAGRNPDLGAVMLLGIQKGGVPLARRIAAKIEAAAGAPVRCGTLDVSFHRDDLGSRLPTPEATDLPASISGATVVLVDSVLYSGRTVRAAFDALHHYGRPERIQLAVLVDRGHRELPISPDFVGAMIRTEKGQRVRVREDYVMVVGP
jgi:pyrimidine operon attenuation protein/uracil phosphoribosyltransferase